MATKPKQDVITEESAVYILRAGTPVYVKTADICAMTGKTKQWIGQLVGSGVLSQRSTPHGAMFDVAAAMRAYCDMLEARAKASEDEADAAAEREKLGADIRIKKAKAVLMELEAKELQGEMHRSEDVLAITEDMVYTIRGMMLAMPGRLAMDAAAASTAAEAAEIIRKEVYKVLRELSRYRYDSKKYEERVRERQKWTSLKRGDNDDEEV